MREHAFQSPPAQEPRLTPGDWIAELRHILFDGTGPSESRLESLLDRVERRS